MAALTGVSATGARGSVGTPQVSIRLTGVSATGAFGFVINSVKPGEGLALRHPTIAFALTGVTGNVGDLALDRPAPALAMVGTAPVAASVTLTSPLPTVQLAGVTGVAGALTLRAPTLTVRFGNGGGAAFTLPLPTLAMVGRAGAVATLAVIKPAPTLAMTGKTEVVGALTLRYQPTLAMSMSSGAVGTIARALPVPALVMSGVVGAFGALTIARPRPGLQLTGHFAAVGVLAFTTPASRLVMQGVTQGTTAQVAATRITYALQTERLALTRYTNFAFNSFAVFGGRYLGASPDGIYELTGDTDAGTAIDAAARFGITDLNTSRVKRVEYVYIGARVAKGKKALLLRVTTNETQQRDYGVKSSISDGLHTTRVDLGMGVESRYWQFELRNREGADFSVDTVEVMPTPTRRRLGAKDA